MENICEPLIYVLADHGDLKWYNVIEISENHNDFQSVLLLISV